MRTLLTVAVIAGAAYVLFSLFVYVMQERMVFLPGLPGRAIEATPEDIGLDFTDVRLETSDGISLHAWHVPARKAPGTVLFFHGNAGNVSHRLESIEIFNSLGLDVLIVDYRGYGRSEGSPSEAGIYRDAETAWRYLVDERGIDPARIVIFGRSLGSAAAAYLTARTDPAALIIESSFTSAADMASTLYPFLPVRLLLRLDFPVVDYVGRTDAPLLVVHSRGDEIVPYSMGRAIFEAATEPKAFLQLSGDHNTAFLLDRDRYVSGLSDFIDAHLADPDNEESRARESRHSNRRETRNPD